MQRPCFLFGDKKRSTVHTVLRFHFDSSFRFCPDAANHDYVRSGIANDSGRDQNLRLRAASDFFLRFTEGFS